MYLETFVRVLLLLEFAVQISAVDKEISSLDMAALQLTDNIKDKDDALRIDERMVMLDGRINLAQRPPSSVASVSRMNAM